MAPSMRRSAKTTGKKPKGFVYRERDMDSVKKRAERQGGNFDSPMKNGFDAWRAKTGDNTIRILPPTWDDHEHYGYSVWVHAYVGPDNSTYVCLQKMANKKCPICAAAKAAKDAGDEEEAKQLRAKEQFWCWVVDRDDDDLVPAVYQMSWTMDRDIAALCIDKKKGKVLLIDHPEEGYDVSMKRQGTGQRTKYIGLAIDRDSSPISEDEDKQTEILDYITENPIPDVIRMYDADYLESMLSGEQETKDEELDEDEEDEKKPRRRSSKDDDEEEEEEKPRRRSSRDDDEEDEEEEEEKPRRGRSSKDEDEEEEEEEEKPSRRGKSSRRDDDEEEEEEQEKPRRRSSKDEEEEEEEEEKPRRGKSSRSSSRDEDEEEEEEKPSRRGKSSRRDEDEDEEEEEEKRPRRRR